MSHGSNHSTQHSAMAEVKQLFKMAPTSKTDMFKLFHNIHMMQMGRWVCPYHVSASLVCQAFGCYLEILLSP